MNTIVDKKPNALTNKIINTDKNKTLYLTNN